MGPWRTVIAFALFLPLPVLRERGGVREFSLQRPKERPSPYPLPEYREREEQPNAIALVRGGFQPIVRSIRAPD